LPAIPFDVTPFRRLYPFQSRWVLCDGLPLHYIDEGSGDPLVLVHGNPTWSFFFRTVIAALAPSYRLVAPDHMGCGLSGRPGEDRFAYTLDSHVANLEGLLDHLGLHQGVTLVLHDWGGMIGMACACRRPERIAGIIVLNTGAFLIPKEKRLPWQLAFIKRTPLLPDLLVRGFNAFAVGATRLGTTKGLPRPVRQAYTAPYASWRNSLAVLRFVQDIPVSPRDRSYGTATEVDERLALFRSTPMLICWGLRDFVFDEIILQEWRRRFPEAEVATFPDAGHYLLEDAGEEVIERMKAFLRRFEDRGGSS
jgi:haloalkane dehalogenase